MRELRVVLLGGRIFPPLRNLLADREKIGRLLLFTTPQTPNKPENFVKTLPQGLRERVVVKRGEIIDPEDYEAFIRRLKELLERWSGPVSVDITSSPKIPALAAWEALRQRQGTVLYSLASSSVVVRFNFKDNEIRIAKEKMEPIRVAQYLHLYGRDVRKNFDVEQLSFSGELEKQEAAYRVALHIIGQASFGIKFLKFFRCFVSVKEEGGVIRANLKERKECKKYYLKNMIELFRFLAHRGLLKLKRENPLEVEVTVNNAGFLTGKWLDFYLYMVLKESGLFYDCDYSVEIPRGEAKNEIDFIGVSKDGVVFVAEAKTGEVGRKDLDTLEATVNLIGGNAVVKYLVAHQREASLHPDALSSLKAQAEEHRINLLFSESLPPENLIKAFKEPKFQPI